jgi:glycerol-3-phosphate dehydrogenase
LAARRRSREGLGALRPSLEDVAKQKFDVIVVGGGINGAGIAREAQRAGYRTLLVERNDFGAGTTSRATRLIHGGLRYLEHGELALVYESLRERETLLREAPHLVRPLRMLVPVYAGDERPPWKIRAGLALYDALSLRKSLPRHRAMPPRALAKYEPGLSRNSLRAAYTMYDAQVEFPERLVVETVRDYIDAGGVAMNHTSAARIISPGGVLRGLVLRDELCADHAGGASPAPTVEIEARCVVNAAGPWADELLRGSDAERHDRLIGGTKGSHLVVDWPGAPKHAIFASANEDGRPFFILPWYRYTLVGTTDLRYDGDPSKARCTPDELRYLIDEANRLFPSQPLARDHVLYTYSGVRPLPYTPKGDESAITRAHFVIDHRKRGGPDGLLSIVGGKLTTYRSLSRVALAAIQKVVLPASGAREDGGRKTEAGGRDASYGERQREFDEFAAQHPELNTPVCKHNPETLAQVAYSVERERAVTLGDGLLRRLPCGWSACHALDGVDGVAAVMAARLGWSAERVKTEIGAYQREVRETLVPVVDIDS